MTILKVEDELARLGTEAAAAQGKSLDEFVSDLLRQAVSSAGVLQQASRNGLPVMIVPPGTPAIDPAVVRRHLEEEGF